MLAYSLSGEVEANLRDTTLKSQADDSLTAITLSPLRLAAQRGAVELQPVTISGEAISGNLSGEFDMANNPLSGVIYQLQEACGSIQGDVLSGEVKTNECTNTSKQTESVKPAESEQSSSKTTSRTSIDPINLEQYEEELSEIVEEEQESAVAPHSEEQLITQQKDSDLAEKSAKESENSAIDETKAEQGASESQDAPQETPAPNNLTAE